MPVAWRGGAGLERGDGVSAASEAKPADSGRPNERYACEMARRVVLVQHKGDGGWSGERSDAGRDSARRIFRGCRIFSANILTLKHLFGVVLLPGLGVAQPTFPTSSCSASSTIAWCMKADGRSCKWAVSFVSCHPIVSSSGGRALPECAGRPKTDLVCREEFECCLLARSQRVAFV